MHLRSAAVDGPANGTAGAGFRGNSEIGLEARASSARIIHGHCSIRRSLENNTSFLSLKVHAVAQTLSLNQGFTFSHLDVESASDRHVLQTNCFLVSLNMNGSSRRLDLNRRLVARDSNIAIDTGNVHDRLVALQFHVDLARNLDGQLHGGLVIIVAPPIRAGAITVWIRNRYLPTIGNVG